MLAATVSSSRTSASPKAFSRSWFSRTIDAEHAVAGEDRHVSEADALGRCPASTPMPRAGCSATRFVDDRAGASRYERAWRRVRRRRVDGGVQAHAVLVVVEVVDGRSRRRPTSGCRCRRWRTPRAACRRRGRRSPGSRARRAIPCWMLLITASSALRCSVSFSSRCVSSNSRAFSSAMPMVAPIGRQRAHVGRRRTRARARSSR